MFSANLITSAITIIVGITLVRFLPVLLKPVAKENHKQIATWASVVIISYLCVFFVILPISGWIASYFS